MKIRYLILFICAFISCSAFENENDGVAYRWENDGLIIENGSSENIYYAVFEQESFSLIDWAAVSTPENKILPNTFIRIDKSDIFDYEDGDTILLYYWKGAEQPFDFFENVMVET